MEQRSFAGFFVPFWSVISANFFLPFAFALTQITSQAGV